MDTHNSIIHTRLSYISIIRTSSIHISITFTEVTYIAILPLLLLVSSSGVPTLGVSL